MKKFLLSFFFAVLFITGSYKASFSEPVKLAITPFGVESETGLDFMSKGIIDLFSSRLAYPGKVIIIDKATVIDALGKTEKVTPDIARNLGQKTNADVVLYGFVLETAQEVAIKAYALDTRSDTEPTVFTVRTGKYENSDLFLPFINRLSAKINKKIFSRDIAEEPSTESHPEQYNIHTHPDNLLKDMEEDQGKKTEKP